MLGARYLGASGQEAKVLNPGPPPGFLKWEQITGEYGYPYNGFGSEVTSSIFGGAPGPGYVPTVDTIMFLSPKVNQTAYSITSSLITIPSASLGYHSSLDG